MISTTRMAAATQSTTRQNGGHQRVLATNWRRCCHRSLSPGPTKPSPGSQAGPVTPTAARTTNPPATGGFDGDHPRPSVSDREADVDGRDQGYRQGIDGGCIQPPEAERDRGLDDAPDDAPEHGCPQRPLRQRVGRVWLGWPCVAGSSSLPVGDGGGQQRDADSGGGGQGGQGRGAPRAPRATKAE